MRNFITKSRRAAVLAGIASACVAGGAASPAVAGADPQLTLKAKKNELAQGGTTRLKGKLRNVPANAGQSVMIFATPYRSYRYDGPAELVKTTTTDQDGRYSVRVKPALNTQYRADTSAASSPKRKVYVFETVKFRLLNAAGNYRVRASYGLKYSPQVQPEFHVERKAYFYFRKRSQERFRRVETSTWQNTAAGVHSEAVINLPKSRTGYRYVIRGCTKYPKFDIGIGPPIASGCPKRINARSARARMLSSPVRVGLEAGP